MPTGTDSGAIPTALYVLRAGAIPTDPDVLFTSDIPGGRIPAASEQAALNFTFTALRTPIKDGNVSFRIPSGWTAPNETADAAGEVTVTTSPDGSTEPVALDAKFVVTGGMEITVNLETLPESGRVIVTYKKGMVQRDAGKVEIKGYFKSGKSLPERASEVIEVTIDNVASGSGTATISPSSVEAGSDDNRLVVRFSAQGSMDGGHVRLTNATNWGAFQGTNASGANYIKISASSGANPRDTAIGDRVATAYFDEFSYGDVLTFTLDNAVAQPNLVSLTSRSNLLDSVAVTYTISKAKSDLRTRILRSSCSERSTFLPSLILPILLMCLKITMVCFALK